MSRPFAGRLGAALLSAALAGCAHNSAPPAAALSPPLSLALSQSAPGQITAAYSVQGTTRALHFEQELGGYRAQLWQPTDSNFRWVKEGDGERIERSDGQPFDRVTFTLPIDYRALPKSYAPFSPFSEGSALIHSGQFHACLAAPCDQPGPLPISVTAKDRIVGVNGRRTPGQARFVSRDAGTNVFVGSLEPITTDAFVAIIDPGLPDSLRQHLDRSLPQAMAHFAAIHGALSFTPELYVSIDDTPEPNGRISTQGGTLPNQIFMHFDGENARERASAGSPFWLDWFFAHEAAHLFQQDRAGGRADSEQEPWLHEGGADAMAALAVAGRGDAERAYAQTRLREAEAACGQGLAAAPLTRASADGNFDLHYQCGMVIWLALDQDLRRSGVDGIDRLSVAFFAKVRGGQTWSEATLLATARELGASDDLLQRISAVTSGRTEDPAMAVGAIGALARRSLGS